MTACGGGDGAAAAQAPTVFAASSLRTALPEIDGRARYSFGSSGTLRQQIVAGAPADVFVAAGTTDVAALVAAGQCRGSVTFAGNRLVLLVARRSAARVRSLRDLQRGGFRIALGASGVPAGTYARALLTRAHATDVLRRNRVSEERDVAGVTGKVALGSADAGFVYHTDALASGGRAVEVALPAAAQPPIRYTACAVRRGGADAAGAAAFLRRLTGPAGRTALQHHGFTTPAA